MKFRQLQDGGEFSQCTGHYQTCLEDTGGIDCNACLQDPSGAACGECHTCWQPLHVSSPDVLGLCINTQDLRDFITADAVPNISVQALYTSLLTNHMDNLIGDDVVNDIVSSITEARDDINAQTASAITETENQLFTKIDEQCPAPGANPPARRRLREASTDQRLRISSSQRK